MNGYHSTMNEKLYYVRNNQKFIVSRNMQSFTLDIFYFVTKKQKLCVYVNLICKKSAKRNKNQNSNNIFVF